MTLHPLYGEIKSATGFDNTNRVNRPQATRRNHVYQPYACPRSFSKCIGNPRLRHAGVGIIWNQV